MEGPIGQSQFELVPRAGFPLEPGDTVRYVKARGGFGAGYFRSWARSGAALIEIPGREAPLRIPANELRPSNDRRMIERRGRVQRDSEPATKRG
jgi:hypothetical protein